MGSGSERSDDIVDGDRGDGTRVSMELRCGHGVTAGYSVAWLMVVSGEGGITGNP